MAPRCVVGNRLFYEPQEITVTRGLQFKVAIDSQFRYVLNEYPDEAVDPYQRNIYPADWRDEPERIYHEKSRQQLGSNR